MNNCNFFLKNFFFVNYFNSFIILNNFKSKSLFTQKKFDITQKKFDINNTNLLVIYFKYFNKIIIKNNSFVKHNVINFYGEFKNSYLYYFNKFNYKYYKNLINLIFSVNQNNKNFVILDNSYKNIFPIYNYIFNFKNIIVYKKYFFINSKFFTYNNWSYYYNNFSKKFNIVLIVILDFYYFNKFFKSLKSINLPTSSLIPINHVDAFVDYPIYVSYYSNFEKFLVLNLLTQITLMSFNYKNYILRIKYLNLFYDFSLKFNLI